ncbi:hypothetical protein AXG93_2779s1140 [Marchantia polymorpha subsp. ruderalis]|uniref:Uncharacterized protein n=1 Tax=Marchantia polymorpha subsp. ruderalis TaxID=1480154 RepID=A0A176W5T2_MARPO|nr:hypothetical protein AXG93_2779s1140 [Marchantia polymorpha subsp. ruderalis]
MAPPKTTKVRKLVPLKARRFSCRAGCVEVFSLLAIVAVVATRIRAVSELEEKLQRGDVNGLAREIEWRSVSGDMKCCGGSRMLLENEDRNAGTRVPSGEGLNELPSAEPEWEDLARPTRLHAKELAKAEEQRAEEARIAKDLRGQIAAAKTKEELCSKIAELTDDCDKEFKCAEELTASLVEKFLKHKGELTDWAKKLSDCESARSSEVECRSKVKLERRRLQDRLERAALR